MLIEIFRAVLKMSAVGTAVSAAILVIKAILDRVGIPRRVTFSLWAIIALRLICPLSLPAHTSVFNALEQKPAAVQTAAVEKLPKLTEYPAGSRAPIMPQAGNNAPRRNPAAAIWLAGMGLIAAGGAASYISLRRRLRFAVRLSGRVYTAENIGNSFVFGLLRPRIYLPEAVRGQSREWIILHEQMHIRRGDHLTKLAAYLILAVHWFNPAVWVMFRMFAADIELACDESVIANIGAENKRAYIDTILELASEKSVGFLCGVYFSKSPEKRRIKNILRSKRCPGALTAAGAAVCICAAAVFGTDAIGAATENKAQWGVYVEVAEPSEAPAEATTAADTADTASIQNSAQSEPTPAPSPTPEPISEEREPIIAQQTASAEVPEPSASAEPEEISEPLPEPEYIEFHKTAAPAAGAEAMEAVLAARGLCRTDGAVKCGTSYKSVMYSWENECSGSVSGISADSRGCARVYFDTGHAKLVNIEVRESGAASPSEQVNFMTDSGRAIEISGLEKGKLYDIVFQYNTKGEWQEKGTFIVF